MYLNLSSIQNKNRKKIYTDGCLNQGLEQIRKLPFLEPEFLKKKNGTETEFYPGNFLKPIISYYHIIIS